MYARDVMTSPVFIVAPQDTVAYARNLMVKHKISRVLVMQDEKPVGILTKKDIGYGLVQRSAAWKRRPLDQTSVAALAVKDPFVVKPDTGVREIARLFVQKTISCVPVVENGKVVGIVTKADLMKSALIATLGGSVRDVMEDVATVSRYHSLDHVIKVMSGRNDKVVVTESDGTIAGIITETNLAFFDKAPAKNTAVGKDVKRVVQGNAHETSGQISLSGEHVTAEDVMTKPVTTITPDCPLTDAIALMGRLHINSLVVMENDTISGILKRDDIIKEVAK
jgi:CBS domain-containing protein